MRSARIRDGVHSILAKCLDYRQGFTLHKDKIKVLLFCLNLFLRKNEIFYHLFNDINLINMNVVNLLAFLQCNTTSISECFLVKYIFYQVL